MNKDCEHQKRFPPLERLLLLFELDDSFAGSMIVEFCLASLEGVICEFEYLQCFGKSEKRHEKTNDNRDNSLRLDAGEACPSHLSILMLSVHHELENRKNR